MGIPMPVIAQFRGDFFYALVHPLVFAMPALGQVER